MIFTFFSRGRLTGPVSVLIHTLNYWIERIAVGVTILGLSIATPVKVENRFEDHQLKEQSSTLTVAPNLSPLIRMGEVMDELRELQRITD